MSKLNPEFYAPYNYQPDYKRARHNLSTKRSTSLQTGVLTPILFRRVYKGDDFKIKPMTLLHSILPLNRQQFDCFQLRTEFYLCPLTNYYGWMDNNSRNDIEEYIEGASKWSVTLFDDAGGTGLIPSDISTGEYTFDEYRNTENMVQKGSLLQYCGVPAGFVGCQYDPSDSASVYPGIFNTINIERVLAYMDIWRCYHANSQYETLPYYNGQNWTTGASSEDMWSTFGSHKLLDQFFVSLRNLSREVSNDLNFSTILSYSDELPEYVSPIDMQIFLFGIGSYFNSIHKQGGGLFPVQHRPDLWRNLLSVTNTTVNATVKADGNGNVLISEIRDKNHFQTFYDQLYYSGGRYSNILRTVTGIRSHHDLKMPELLASQTMLIDPSNVTAMAGTETAELGQKAANIDSFNQGDFVRVRPDVDSILVCCVSVVPLVTYSQGFDPEVIRLSYNDDFKPALQGMSFENIPRGYYSALPEITWEDSSETYNLRVPDLTEIVGKNNKWMSERTDVNHCYGEFTPIFGEFEDMLLTRRYSKHGFTLSQESGGAKESLIFDMSPYVNPLDYNVVFAMNDLWSEPFALHYAFDIKAKRQVLKRDTPRM